MSTQTRKSVDTFDRIVANETEAQALHRLAAQAREKGVRVLVYPYTNEHFAESASHPGELHRVTMVSCDCRGWMRHGRCTHNAAVLDMYGNLPPVEPDGGPELGPDGGGQPSPVPHSATSVTERSADIVVSIAPAPRRQGATPRVENPHTITKPSPWNRAETLDHYRADAVEIGGRMHRVGDRVRYAYRKGEPASCVGTIGAIYRTAERARWKVTFRENDFGRFVSDVRAIDGEEVRHAA